MTLIPFDYDGQEVRVFDLDGEPWFAAVDICGVLEVGNPTQALSRLDWIYRDQRGDWRPYQAQIETGRLAVKLSRCENSRTGEEFAAHTVRITTKGAVALADLLGVAPADLANALDDNNLAAAA